MRRSALAEPFTLARSFVGFTSTNLLITPPRRGRFALKGTANPRQMLSPSCRRSSLASARPAVYLENPFARRAPPCFLSLLTCGRSAHEGWLPHSLFARIVLRSNAQNNPHFIPPERSADGLPARTCTARSKPSAPHGKITDGALWRSTANAPEPPSATSKIKSRFFPRRVASPFFIFAFCCRLVPRHPKRKRKCVSKRSWGKKLFAETPRSSAAAISLSRLKNRAPKVKCI